MSVTVFNKPLIKTIRNDLETALKTIESKHGIKLGIGSISFSSNSFRTRLEATTQGSSQVDSPVKYQNNFKKHCYLYGLKPSDLGRSFDNGRYMVVGMMNPNAKSGQIIVKDTKNNKLMRFNPSLVGNLT